MKRPTHFLTAAAFTLAMSGIAAAQTPTAPDVAGDTRSSWVATGFLGSNFGTTNDNLEIESGASLNFGGQIAYLWKGTVGGEFIADFAPNVGDNLLFANEPGVSSYMGNLITAVPLGASGRYQPYVSGGFGIVRLRVDLFDDIENPETGTFRASGSDPGGNIGGGFMAFTNHFGVRADIRYFKTMSDHNPIDADNIGEFGNEVVLAGLGFWRGNVGLAFRW